MFDDTAEKLYKMNDTNPAIDRHIQRQIEALQNRISMVILEPIPGTPAADEFERRKQSTRYPYTFAYDMIRQCGGMGEISRSQVSVVFHSMYDMDEDVVEREAKKIADVLL